MTDLGRIYAFCADLFQCAGSAKLYWNVQDKLKTGQFSGVIHANCGGSFYIVFTIEATVKIIIY